MSPQRPFEEALEQLKRDLLTMAGLAEEAVRLAVEALLERDEAKAESVIRGDTAIDELEVAVDASVIKLLALQQPMAGDLRLLTMALKISNDLERVGDHAVNIAEEAELALDEPRLATLPELEEMARMARQMLAGALDSFIRRDTTLAREIIARDDRVDNLDRNLFRVLLTHMMEDPRKITLCLDLLLVVRNLERIADLATNIAEDVVFLVEGRLIKHHPEALRKVHPA